MTTQEPKIVTNKSKTKRQDDIHLWLTEEDNLKLVFDQLANEIIDKVDRKYRSKGYISTQYHEYSTKTIVSGVGPVRIKGTRRAVPVGNGSIDFKLRFELPIILEHDTMHPAKPAERRSDGSVRNEAVPEIHKKTESKKLVDITVAGLIKPDLESIDRAMKQINKYIYNSSEGRTGDTIYLEAIITYDENDRYDCVLDEEDIQVVRIPEPK